MKDDVVLKTADRLNKEMLAEVLKAAKENRIKLLKLILH